jgi:hypothetical protein
MQITADFGDLCRTICPRCARNVAVRYRSDSREYVHDEKQGTATFHSLCLANGLWLKYQDLKDA